MHYDGRDPRGPHRPDPPLYPDWEPDPYQHANTRAPWSGRFSDLPLRFCIVILAPLVTFCAAAVAVGALFMYYTVVFPDPLRPISASPSSVRGVRSTIV